MKTIKFSGLSIVFIGLLAISTLPFQSCEKAESYEFVGEWLSIDHEIVFTPNKDFTYIDRLGSPWTGTLHLTVDGETETITEINLYPFRFSAQGLGIFIYLDGLDVFYKTERYEIDKDFAWSYWDGEFSIDATAVSNNNKTLTISGALSAVKIDCKNGIEYAVKDKNYINHLKFSILYLLDDRELLCQILDEDVIFRGNGSWNKSGEFLNLEYNLHDWYAENIDYEKSIRVEYDININKELILTETIDDLTNNEIVNDILFGFEPGSLSQLKYRITFQETEEDFFGIG